ncbi:MAG: PAS domain S-box protein, partial [Anaerolineales bacterium]
IPQLTFDSGILRRAEKLIGLSQDAYRVPIEPGGIWHQAITETEATFFESYSEPIAEALPKALRRLAPRLASMLGVEQGIIARLTVGGEPYGALLFHGPGISEADVPAVTAFANQTSIALENALAELELRKHRDRLEEMVEQRTAELQRTNVDLEAEVAERKRTAAALRSLTARYQAILAAAPDIIVEVDNDKVYTWSNRAGFTFFGDDVAGKEASFYFEGEQDTYDVVRPLFEGSEDVIYVESWQRRQDGEKRLLAWWCRSLLNAEGEVTGALSTARDITGQRQAAEELREYSDRLEEMVEARTLELEEAQEQLLRHERLAVLGQLAGGVGHELRNPLGAIKNAAYFLEMAIDDPDPDIRQTLEILNREVAASDRIISSLLDYARPKTASRRKTDINEVVQEVLARSEVPKNVKVTTRLRKDLPVVLADRDHLGQVFGNIIRNAYQAMPEGGRLTVKTSQVPGTGSASGALAISFKDTGIGIYSVDLRRVFEPLFTTKAKGIGLGLALSKMLIEAHGGSIEVASQEGKGSTFTVTLPLSVSA